MIQAVLGEHVPFESADKSGLHHAGFRFGDAKVSPVGITPVSMNASAMNCCCASLWVALKALKGRVGDFLQVVNVHGVQLLG